MPQTCFSTIGYKTDIWLTDVLKYTIDQFYEIFRVSKSIDYVSREQKAAKTMAAISSIPVAYLEMGRDARALRGARMPA